MVNAQIRGSQGAGHTVDRVVRPANGRRETLLVLLALAAIIALMLVRACAFGGEQQQTYLRPYQQLDSVLSNPERTLFQSLLASMGEIEGLREDEGQWPEAALLAMDSIPPFDPRFLPSTLQGYLWTDYNNQSWVDYIGTLPEAGQGRTFLLRLIDLHAEYHPHPHPGIDYDPNMRVSSQIWIYDEPDRFYPGERLAEAGWMWVVTPNDRSLNATEEQVEQANQVYQQNDEKNEQENGQ
ncbi:MAG: hypothetical protein P9M14_11480 [Candidatus Alcyoniella australis]|nr:hypothetical protein [Candidatus Alcyoniella australis]